MELVFDPTNPPPSPEPSQSSTPSPIPSETKKATPRWGYVGLPKRNSFFRPISPSIRKRIITNIKTGLAKIGLTALFAAAPKILPQICRSSLNYGGGPLLIIFGAVNNICGEHKGDDKALSCVKRVAGVGELVLLATVEIVTSLELVGDNETAQKIAEYLPPAFLTVFAFKMLFDYSLGIRSPQKRKELALIEGLPTATQVVLITAGPIVKAINPELALLGGSAIAGAQSLYYFTKGISMWCCYCKKKSKLSAQESVELNLPRNIQDDSSRESSEDGSDTEFFDLRRSLELQ